MASPDEKFMRECFRLAAKGAGSVSPNPLVGAVLLEEGAVVARGYHKRFGGPHAEVECLRKFSGDASRATLYVNLEPCSHYGKTPPCADLIIQRGIKNVVVAMKDPNPLVHGKGIRKLRAAGVKVQCGVLEEKASDLNRVFVKNITTEMPYVHLKIAQSNDGFIARKKGKLQYITSIASRRLVHEWRARYDAVLVGAGTIESDNPRLDVRLVKGRVPAVVILDGNLRVSGREKIFTATRNRNVFLCIKKSSSPSQKRKVKKMISNGVRVLEFASTRDGVSLTRVLRALYRNNIGSILVEGGANVFNQFVLQNLTDEFSIFIAEISFGSGVRALSSRALKKADRLIARSSHDISTIGGDILVSAVIKR